MSDKIIWASEAEDSNIQAPSVEKQKSGWTQETPPHEWFNWHMNRTDRRLNDLEMPSASTQYESLAGTRENIILAGEKFVLPAEYIVGTDSLRVYLDGIRCYEGEDKQYVEAGTPGATSNYIRWNDDIGPEYDITIDIPIRGTDDVLIFDQSVSVEKLTQSIAEYLAGQTLNIAGNHVREDSMPDTRESDLAEGSHFTVPEYKVGTGQLSVYVEGLLCTAGNEFNEVGDPGSTSNAIEWTFTVARDLQITAIVTNITATPDENTEPEGS